MTELVLRLHCKYHRDDRLVDFLVNADRVPAVIWSDSGQGAQHHELGDVGWGSALHEGFIREHPHLGGPIIEQEVHGVAWKAPWPPGAIRAGDEWQGRVTDGDGNHQHLEDLPQPEPGIYELPGGMRWDPERSMAYSPSAPDSGAYTDLRPEAGQLHVRYEITCPRAACTYGATITRPALLALLSGLHSDRHHLKRLVQLAATAEPDARHWTVTTHELFKDEAATAARPWAPGEEWRPWVPTPMLNAELHALRRLAKYV